MLDLNKTLEELRSFDTRLSQFFPKEWKSDEEPLLFRKLVGELLGHFEALDLQLSAGHLPPRAWLETLQGAAGGLEDPMLVLRSDLRKLLDDNAHLRQQITEMQDNNTLLVGHRRLLKKLLQRVEWVGHPDTPGQDCLFCFAIRTTSSPDTPHKEGCAWVMGMALT